MNSSAMLAILVVALCLATTGVSAARPQRTLLTIPTLADVYASCKTKASTSAFVTSGSATVKSTSVCSAYSESISQISKLVEDYLKNIKKHPENGCTKISLEAMLRACAQTIAKVYTGVQIEIDVNGDGIACASGSSEGDAFATAYSALLVNLWIGATDGSSSAEAEAQVTALNFALSKAWAAAKVKRCQIGEGEVKDFEESLAEQVRQALSCVTVEVAVTLCDQSIAKKVAKGKCGECGAGELQSLLEATESTSEIGVCTSTVDLVDVAVGNAATEDRDPVPCEGDSKKCCDAFYNDKSECLCGRNCLFKKNPIGLWANSERVLCYCPNFEALD